MNPIQHNKPSNITPYSSLIYLRHYVGKEGIGRFITKAGVTEPSFTGGSREPFLNVLAENFESYLRKLVNMRPERLPEQLIKTETEIKELLQRLELEAYKPKGLDTKSSLGESLLWILNVNGVTSEYFDVRAKINLKTKMLSVSERIGQISLENLLPRAIHQKPKDRRMQYDYLRGYLPRYFK